MAESHPTPAAPTTALTPAAFMADRVAFWARFTGFTLKTTVGLIIFCAWLWWCAMSGFSLLHIIVLPIAIGISTMVL